MTNQRYSVSINSVTVAAAVADSTAINYGDFANGMVYVPDSSALTTLTWHACATIDGAYLAAEDAASAAVTQTATQNQAHPIPVALTGARFLKITGNGAGGTVGVTLKD